ncbi:MAG: 50S ribosomal protein L7/L12 [Candidatus Kerfeldbacteria bacterium]|nr:50S ribosomal protein L7/L12 [Candidatus Kerfeldbacteria bacterium]
MANDGQQQEPVEVPEKFKGIVDQLSTLSVLDMAELVKVLEKKFGVSAAAPMMVAAAGAPAAGEAAEEKTSFDVELTESGPNKIGAIKVVREVTEKGLKEAKDLVDGAPKIVLEGATKEKAEEVKKKLEEAGAKVTLK